MAEDQKLDLLRRVPMFADMSSRELGRLAKALDVLDLEEGTVLTRQGRFARQFFVVLEGSADVRRDGEVIADVGPGEFVGEMALLTGEDRSATVTAATPMTILVGPSQVFAEVLDVDGIGDMVRSVVEERRPDPEA